MAQIDRVREMLNTLRVALSLVVGTIVLLIGGLVDRYDHNEVDSVFWSGVIATAFCVLVVVFLINKITKKTNDIGEM